MTLEAVISQTLIPSVKGGRALALEIMVRTNAVSALINERQGQPDLLIDAVGSKRIRNGDNESGSCQFSRKAHDLQRTGHDL